MSAGRGECVDGVSTGSDAGAAGFSGSAETADTGSAAGGSGETAGVSVDEVLFSSAFTGTMAMGTTGAIGEGSGAATGVGSATGGSGTVNCASGFGVSTAIWRVSQTNSAHASGSCSLFHR